MDLKERIELLNGAAEVLKKYSLNSLTVGDMQLVAGLTQYTFEEPQDALNKLDQEYTLEG